MYTPVYASLHHPGMYTRVYTSLLHPPGYTTPATRIHSSLLARWWDAAVGCDEALGSTLRLIRLGTAFCAPERAEVSLFLCFRAQDYSRSRARIG